MPVAADYALVFVLLILGTVAEYLWFWPRFRASVASGDPKARTRAYIKAVAAQWAFSAAALGIWAYYGRPASALLLPLVPGWRVVLGIALVALMLLLTERQLRAVRRLTQERRAKVAARLSSVGFVLPHTIREYRWFLVLSVTAGTCEELLYRGYLPWFFAPWLGTAGSYAAVLVMFGLGHAYQGRSGALKATAAGVVMCGIVLATGSLIPAMIIHALVDIGSGTLGYLVLRDSIEKSTEPEREPRAMSPSSASWSL